MSAGHRSERVKLVTRFCLALLSRSHGPETSLRSVCVIHGAEVSFRPYVLARAFLQSRTRPHIHELVFSLCPYAVWCCAAVLLPTNWPFHCSPNKTEAVTPTPPPTRLSFPQNQLHTPFTHINTIAPLVRRLLLGSSYGPCVTSGPLGLIRCYNQTTKGLTCSPFFTCCPIKRAAPLMCLRENAEHIRENNTGSVLFSHNCKSC